MDGLGFGGGRFCSPPNFQLLLEGQLLVFQLRGRFGMLGIPGEPVGLSLCSPPTAVLLSWGLSQLNPPKIGVQSLNLAHALLCPS